MLILGLIEVFESNGVRLDLVLSNLSGRSLTWTQGLLYWGEFGLIRNLFRLKWNSELRGNIVDFSLQLLNLGEVSPCLIARCLVSGLSLTTFRSLWLVGRGVEQVIAELRGSVSILQLEVTFACLTHQVLFASIFKAVVFHLLQLGHRCVQELWGPHAIKVVIEARSWTLTLKFTFQDLFLSLHSLFLQDLVELENMRVLSVKTPFLLLELSPVLVKTLGIKVTFNV